jgi:hypothetical protein
MKKLIILVTSLLFAVSVNAQEKKQHRVSNFDGMIKIFSSAQNLTITGYDGKDVIIEAESGNDRISEKAAGLKLVTPGGVDNTGIALNIEEYKTEITTGTDSPNPKKKEVRTLEINIPNSDNFYKNYTIKVPQNIILTFRDLGNHFSANTKSLTIQSFSGELDINCIGTTLDISDFSGNIIANNSMLGKTKIIFKQLSQDKISSINSDNELDITLPANSKVNLRMNSSSGNMFTDFNLTKARKDKEVSNSSLPVESFSSKTASSIPSNNKERVVNGYGSKPAVSIQTNRTENIVVSNNRLSPFQAIQVEGSPTYTIAVGSVFNTSDNYNYTLNDGGVYLNLSSRGDIYLRKK